MIAWQRILAASVLTAGSVALASAALHWPRRAVFGASALSLVAIVVWRAIANAAGLNDDFMPLVSIGDCGCLIAGGIGPGVLLPAARPFAVRNLLPLIAGAAAGFVVNVVIL